MTGYREYEILGREHSVYPGHPVTVAYIITQLYVSFEDATEVQEGHQYSNALGDNDVPGAGGNVSAALSFLHYLKTGILSWEDAIKYADESWATCDGQKEGSSWGHREGWKPCIDDKPCTPEEYYINRWKKGQKQADRIKPLLKQKITTWLRNQTCKKDAKNEMSRN
jgi:hypothetical protein